MVWREVFGPTSRGVGTDLVHFPRGGLTLSDELMGVGWVGREKEERRVGKLGLV